MSPRFYYRYIGQERYETARIWQIIIDELGPMPSSW